MVRTGVDTEHDAQLVATEGVLRKHAVHGLLDDALGVLGEHRRERRLPIEIVPSAHIPSLLTAAATVAAFATIWAAYALYGFIGPLTAFVLLGATGIGTMFAAAIHGPAQDSLIG